MLRCNRLSSMALAAFIGLSQPVLAEEYAGPLLPHVGGHVTTAFSNRFGPDAEGTVTFTSISPEKVDITYSSTRGLVVPSNIRIIDRETAKSYVLGYASGMPLLIPNTTSLGISGASLVDLRTTGKRRSRCCTTLSSQGSTVS